MTRLDARRVAVVCASLSAVAVVSLPSQDAQALVGIGAEGIWVPYGSDTITAPNDSTLDVLHTPGTFGASLYFTFGLDLLSAGLKGNYVSRNYFDDDNVSPFTSYQQVDINVIVQSKIPLVPIGFFAEGGASLSPDGGNIGFNIGAGLRWSPISLPLVDPYLGIGANYASFGHSVNNVDYDISGLRMNLSLGVRLSL